MTNPHVSEEVDRADKKMVCDYVDRKHPENRTCHKERKAEGFCYRHLTSFCFDI